MRNLIGLCLLFCCAVPSVTAQDAKPSPDTGTIYFYRLRDAYAAMFKPSVYLDKAQVARMRNGRFLSKDVSPGKHTITSTFEGNGLELDVKPGESYYFRVEMTRPTMLKNARGQVTLVAPEQGKFEVGQLKPAEPEDLK